jgi:hypothetical protein
MNPVPAAVKLVEDEVLFDNELLLLTLDVV